MVFSADFLPRVLTQPDHVCDLSPLQWDRLIRLAKTANVMPRLSYLLQQNDLIDAVPAPARWRVVAEIRAAEKYRLDTLRELDHLAEALKEIKAPVCLLKGAAYVAANLPAAKGRTFSDIDIMVPKEALAETEAAVRRHGWMLSKENPYDDQYYRRWMHQIPPLQHIFRGSTLDVHHTITPETAKFPVNARKLFERAVDIGGALPFKVLSREDLVIHSATHLFLEGETNNGYRDLSDLSLLLAEFSRDPNFFDAVLTRSRDLNLQTPVFYALYFLRRWYGLVLPDAIDQQLEILAPSRFSWSCLRWIFRRALPPKHGMVETSSGDFARWLLFVRGHYLRMPLRLLIPHLTRKALIRGNG
ncbi:MAG: nucleotidyltransferase domain-containing protein [Magnetospiraceae bacterium]